MEELLSWFGITSRWFDDLANIAIYTASMAIDEFRNDSFST